MYAYAYAFYLRPRAQLVGAVLGRRRLGYRFASARFFWSPLFSGFSLNGSLRGFLGRAYTHIHIRTPILIHIQKRIHLHTDVHLHNAVTPLLVSPSSFRASLIPFSVGFRTNCTQHDKPYDPVSLRLRAYRGFPSRIMHQHQHYYHHYYVTVHLTCRSSLELSVQNGRLPALVRAPTCVLVPTYCLLPLRLFLWSA